MRQRMAAITGMGLSKLPWRHWPPTIRCMRQVNAPKPLPTFESFRDRMLAAGHDEVLVRPWAAGTVVAPHTHPFEAEALVVEGEMWLAIGDGPLQHLRPGDTFHLAAHELHREHYGPDGATYWVARKSV